MTQTLKKRGKLSLETGLNSCSGTLDSEKQLNLARLIFKTLSKEALSFLINSRGKSRWPACLISYYKLSAGFKLLKVSHWMLNPVRASKLPWTQKLIKISKWLYEIGKLPGKMTLMTVEMGMTLAHRGMLMR